jgi:hypothetical protein
MYLESPGRDRDGFPSTAAKISGTAIASIAASMISPLIPRILHLSSLLAIVGACVAHDPAPAEDVAGDVSDRGGIGVIESDVTVTVTVTGTVSAVVIDPRRSLAVTDVALQSQFTLEAVLNQLAEQSQTPGLTGQQLFQQLWDTQNTTAAGVTGTRHCDAEEGTLEGFPYSCRAEGAMASSPMSLFSIVGVYNRFDLASPDGGDCGEYRMVFARNDGKRAFIIFEAVLPNQTQDRFDGLFGCRPVENFWAQLSAVADPSERAARLHDFYFQGLPAFGPVISVNNYGRLPGSRQGEVRVNQFVQAPWELHEFKLTRATSSAPFQFAPVSVKVNPFGDLFRDGGTHPRTAAFQQFFPSQVQKLALNDINRFDMSVLSTFNAGESNVNATGNYGALFSPTSAFAGAIQAELDRIGSPLTPANIVARAQALSCAGCHQLSNGADLGGGLTWPSSAAFVHSTEFQEAGPDGQRFRISPALTDVFLPNRANILQSFLTRTRCIPDSTRCDFACGFGGGQTSDDCIVKCSSDGSTWVPFANCGWAQSGTTSSSCMDSVTSPPQATCGHF